MRANNWLRFICSGLILGTVALIDLHRAHGASRWGAGYFPNVSLTSQEGNTFRFYDDLLKGKSVAVNVIYTTCTDACPLETARLTQVHNLLEDRMGKELFFYSITIDPKRDTVKALKAYADKFRVGAGWLFLTGNDADIKLVTKKLGLSRQSDLATRDGHAPSLMLGNEPKGQWMRNSAVDNPRFLASTMRNFFGWRDIKPETGYADGRPLTPGRGEYLFQSRCSACHTIGGGETNGPDLKGVTARRGRNWVARYIQMPEIVRAEGDPIAATPAQKYKNLLMPNLSLSGADAADLIAYIEGGAEKNQSTPGRSVHH